MRDFEPGKYALKRIIFSIFFCRSLEAQAFYQAQLERYASLARTSLSHYASNPLLFSQESLLSQFAAGQMPQANLAQPVSNTMTELTHPVSSSPTNFGGNSSLSPSLKVANNGTQAATHQAQKSIKTSSNSPTGNTKKKRRRSSQDSNASVKKALLSNERVATPKPGTYLSTQIIK